ncbi:MAG: hypothetical protein JWO38_7684 [Gemmataceae bacterium]|nr:hypothetical protein [Gemmataceae bacterium]
MSPTSASPFTPAAGDRVIVTGSDSSHVCEVVVPADHRGLVLVRHADVGHVIKCVWLVPLARCRPPSA